MSDTTKLNIPAIREWVTGLRSDDYRQGTGRLVSEVHGELRHCCLGVACDLFAERVGIELKRVDLHRDDDVVAFTYVWPNPKIPNSMVSEGDVLPESVRAYLGVNQFDPHVDMDETDYETSLTHLNDARGWTFRQIADAIEATYLTGRESGLTATSPTKGTFSMTETIRPSFLGVPIIGDKRSGSTRVEQWPRGLFEDMFTAMLAEPFFLEFGWTQYTPYFNDGDTREFGCRGFWVRTVGQETVGISSTDDEDHQGDHHDERLELSTWGSGHGTLGKRVRRPGSVNYDESTYQYVGEREELYNQARAFSNAIEAGHFENVLLDLFGDHAEITVRKDGITIEEYSHD